MRSGFDANNQSAAKRIIPAAAMLALSAVMLSTSTYAWFTMNKEVQMTGLNMSATAGEGMEIALASVNESKTIKFDGLTDGHPSDEESEKGWKSAVVVGHYYKDIGKLRPASSTNGKDLYDAKNASNGGTEASEFKKITLGDDTMAQVEHQTTLDESASDVSITSNGKDGYYVDIPVHLRTNKPEGDETKGDIYYKMKIKNFDESSSGGSGSSGSTGTLYKAVRVAFIPGDGDSSSEANIFAFDDEYYTAGQAVSSDSGRSAVTVKKDSVVDTDEFPTGEGSPSGLKIPYAKPGEKYGHLDFTVRIWLEGESKSCSDKTSGQSWNIDLAFSLDKFADDPSTSSTP